MAGARTICFCGNSGWGRVWVREESWVGLFARGASRLASIERGRCLSVRAKMLEGFGGAARTIYLREQWVGQRVLARGGLGGVCLHPVMLDLTKSLVLII